VNRPRKESRVANSLDQAIKDDPHFEWASIDGLKGIRRAGESSGNTLAWKISMKAGEPTTLLFHKTDNQAVITVTVSTESMRPAATSITITPASGDALDPKVFGALRLRTMLTEITEQMESPFLRRMLEQMGHTGWADPFIEIPRPGRKGRPPTEYAIWADRYVARLHTGDAHPLKWLTQQYPGFSESALRAILNTARTRGLLTQSPSGKAGGELTQAGIDLLNAAKPTITSGGN